MKDGIQVHLVDMVYDDY